MSIQRSPTKGKRSLLDIIQGPSSTPKAKRRSSRRSTSSKREDLIECRDILTPNTRELVNMNKWKSSKIFNDSIHTHITLEPVCVRIIDTPQYQRLHGLKQLGTCDFVFRGATHTRFEHCVGVAHMAERVVKTIRNNQPDLGITDVDVLCVKIAGLCHDIGHGPFSHVFDGVFIKTMYPNGIDGKGKEWRHEDGSVMMFRYLLQDNDIDLGDHDLSPPDILFIEEIIQGTTEHERRGRMKSKFFLYDIVNNARSGLDVDKLDYFQRDMIHTGISTATTSRDFDRFIELAHVMKAEPIEPRNPTAIRSRSNGIYSAGGEKNGDNGDDEYPLMICYPEKMVRETVALFATRFNMHQQVYTHKSVKQVEFMITDALKLADPYIRIQGTVTEKFPSGQYKMSETIHDMKAFMQMKDSILDIISFSATSNELLKPAQDIIERIHRRQLYRFVGVTSSLHHGGEIVWSKSEKEILEELIVMSQRSKELEEASFSLDDNAHLGFDLHDCNTSGYVQLTKDDLIVEKMRIHYGMKGENPVDRMRFFPKHANLQANAIAKRIDECMYETVLPRVFEDRSVRLFCRNADKFDTARVIFEKWCEEANARAFPSSLSQSQPDGFLSQPDGDFMFA